MIKILKTIKEIRKLENLETSLESINTNRIIIDRFEITHPDYYVIDLFISEGLSDITYLKAFVIFKERNVWTSTFHLEHNLIFTILFNDHERVFHTKVTKIIKKKYKETNNMFSFISGIEIHAYHHLFNLSFNNEPEIYLNKSINHILEEISIKNNLILENSVLELDENIFPIFIKYLESDLHFLERLIQMNGCFYICDNRESKINIFDNIEGYNFVSLEIENFSINSCLDNYNKNQILEIFSCEEDLVPANISCRSINDNIPLDIIGEIEEIQSSFGKLHIYENDFIKEKFLEKFTLSLNKKFVNKIFSLISTCWHFSPGKKIFVNDFFLQPMVINHINHEFMINDYHFLFSYKNSFTCQSIEKSFVSKKNLFSPIISNVHVGKVVAFDENLEIFTNDKSEIYVQFPWIKKNVPCPVKVAQNWAGKAFGTYIIPRVGELVLIYFINGNPNKPIAFGGLHSLTNRSPCEEKDKDKIIVARSHILYGDNFEKCHEISLNDTNIDPRFFLKAYKQMNVLIDNNNEEEENSFNFLIEKKSKNVIDIKNGDFLFNIDGIFLQRIKGIYTIEIKRNDKGSDLLIDIQDEGKWIVKVAGDVLIDARGEILIKSDIGITLDAPKINFIATDTIKSRAINLIANESDRFSVDTLTDINMKALGEIISDTATRYVVNSLEEVSMKTEGSFNMISLLDLSMKTLGTLKADAATMINFNSDIIQADALTLLSLNSGLNFSGKATLIELESALEFSILSGLSLSINSGLEMEISSGLELTINSGLEMSLSSGLATEISSGLSTNISSGLEIGINAGLEVMIDAGLSMNLNSGLSTNMATGLMFGIESGLDVSIESGLSLSLFATLAMMGRTTFTKLMQRPAI